MVCFTHLKHEIIVQTEKNDYYTSLVPIHLFIHM